MSFFFRGMLTLWMCGLFGLMENMVGIDDLMIKFPPKTFKFFVLLWKLYRWKNVMRCSRHAYITLWLPAKLFLPTKMVASTKNVVVLNFHLSQFNFDKTIVDSGTTTVRLPIKVFKAVVAAIEREVLVSLLTKFCFRDRIRDYLVAMNIMNIKRVEYICISKISIINAKQKI